MDDYPIRRNRSLPYVVSVLLAGSGLFFLYRYIANEASKDISSASKATSIAEEREDYQGLLNHLGINFELPQDRKSQIMVLSNRTLFWNKIDIQYEGQSIGSTNREALEDYISKNSSKE